MLCFNLSFVLNCHKVECNPEINQKKLTKFCRERDIALIAYSPLGQLKESARTPNFLFDGKVQQIADKHNKKPAQIVLRYLVWACTFLWYCFMFRGVV